MNAAKETFAKDSKKVLKEKLSKNPKTLEKYRIDCINSFNILSQITYNEFNNPKSNDSTRWLSKQIFNNALAKIKAILLKLELTDFITSLPQTLGGQIDADTVKHPKTKLIPKSEKTIVTACDLSHIFQNEPPNPDKIIMTTQIDFIKLAAATLTQCYEGDPMKLESFINSINLLEPLATSQELKDTLFNFIKTKLSGKALETLPSTTNTVQQIVVALRNKIKPESSKVIEGRLAALKADRQALQSFSKTAEELADSLRRSLVMEGMTQEKATEITVEKTVKMCRASARSDLVKSVLASSKFIDPKEVISTFIVETGQEAEERQILAYRSYRSQNNNYNNNTNTYRNKKFTSNNQNNNWNNRNNYRPNNRSNNNNFHARYVNPDRQRQSYNRNVRHIVSENGQDPVPDQQELEANPNNI